MIKFNEKKYFFRKRNEAFLEMRNVIVPIFDRLQPMDLEFMVAIAIAIWRMGMRSYMSVFSIDYHYTERKKRNS